MPEPRSKKKINPVERSKYAKKHPDNSDLRYVGFSLLNIVTLLGGRGKGGRRMKEERDD